MSCDCGEKKGGSSAEKSRTGEGGLPLTGPMYIISEARMRRESEKWKDSTGVEEIRS